MSSSRSKLRNRFHEILKTHSKGLSIDKFWNNYQKKYSKNPNKADYGVSKLSELFDLFPEDFLIQEINGSKHVTIVEEKSKKTDPPSSNKDTDQSQSEEPISLDTAIQILKQTTVSVLLKEPNGLPPSQFWERFYKISGSNGRKHTDPAIFGINSGRKSDILKLIEDTVTLCSNHNGRPELIKLITKKEPINLETAIEKVRKTAITVLANEPNGLPSSKFWECFYKISGPEGRRFTDPAIFGCKRKAHILEYIEDTVYWNIQKGTEVLKLKSPKTPKPQSTSAKPIECTPGSSDTPPARPDGSQSVLESSLDTLKEQVHAVLGENPQGLPLSEFWVCYQKKYQLSTKNLPKPNNFGVASKLAIIGLLPDIEHFKNKGQAYIRLSDMSGWYMDRSGSQPRRPASSPQRMDGARHYAIPGGQQPMFYPPHQPGPPHMGGAQGFTPYPAPGPRDMSPSGGFQARRGEDRSMSRERSGSRDREGTFESPYTFGGSQGRENLYRPSPSSSSRVEKRVSKEQLNSVVEDCIERLAESGEYVSEVRIQKLLLQHFGVGSLANIGVRRIDEISVIHEHTRMQCKVNAYIQAFVKCRSIGTAHELQENLREFVPERQEFKELKLGPFVKQPLVYEYFKVPQTTQVAEIDTADILEYLKQYLTEKDLWTNRDHTLQMFLAFIVEQRGIDDPYELGIRMRSLPLAIQVLKKAQRDCGSTYRVTMEAQKQSVQNDVQQAYHHFQAAIINKEPGLCVFRQSLSALQPYEATSYVLNRVISLYNSMDLLCDSARSRRARRKSTVVQVIQSFLKTVADDPLIAMLFQFCACTSDENIQEQLQDILGIRDQAPDTDPHTSTPQQIKPPQDQIVKLALRYLDRCVMNGPLNLDHLARIESKLLEDLNFAEFNAMTGDTFLEYVLSTPQIKKFLTECGGSILGNSSGGSSGNGAIGCVSLPDLVEFIRQCGITRAHGQISMLEDALCSHYGVREIQMLGHGSMSHLVSASERQKVTSTDITVVYEGALVAKSRSMVTQRNSQAGILGHQTKQTALAALQNCPLLEDLGEWSHWQHIFQPELGDLKDFVHKFGGVNRLNVDGMNNTKMTMTTNIVALEIQPGRLLKVTTQTSPEMFAKAAINGDVRSTCGHLASLIVTNKGLDNTPLALLANHVHTALLTMHADSGSAGPPGAPACVTSPVAPVTFVLECLVMLPQVLATALADKVYLEPLSRVLGNSRSKDALYECAQTSREMNRLQHLGLVLGYQTWRDSISSAFKPPADCMQKVEVIEFGQGEIIEIVEDSSDSECEAMEEDSSDPLSDVEFDEKVDITTPAAIGDTSPAETCTISGEMSPPESQTASVPDDTAASDGEVTSVNTQHTVVETIRREEFGVGVVLSEDGQKLMLKQQERQGRSLDRLSRDLYSKDTHFVLELIQNADDNDYSETSMRFSGDQRPAVKFIVDEKCIEVYNNESGFEEKNIRALCDVGQSTKGKHKFGYIGQKGIGFKSVFRITDRPEVHSKGYHMCFDVNSGPMGYILPHWIDDRQREEENERWTTHIVLPLKESMCSRGQTVSLVARFHDVHPSLLLFLHRLRKLSIVNKVDNTIIDLCRRDIGDNIIEIAHGGVCDKWLVEKKMLDASKISLQAKSGIEVESTEIALAFPLQGKSGSHYQVLPEKQPVFAFLPLRSYGFRFVIQGDFDVPSSREDIDKDSVWNQWLRNEIHTVFIEALEAFKKHPDLSGLEAVCSYMQFVPLEDEILDFFKPVATNILQHLKAKPCLPTSGIQWKLPSQLVLCQDPVIREVVSSSLLRQHLSLDYLHKDVARALNPPLLQNLGIQVLSMQHLVEIGKVILSDLDFVTGFDTAMQRIAKWLVCVYRTMDEFERDQNLLDLLKTLEIIPTSDNRVTSLSKESVFFPLDDQDISGKGNQGPVDLLQKDLNTLHNGLFSCVNDVMRSQLRKLLDELGVKKLTPQEIVDHHILPIFRNGSWKDKPRTLIIAYVMYVKLCHDRYPNIVNMEELAKVVVLSTNRGVKRPLDEAIHLTSAFGSNIVDLSVTFPGYEWVLLDATYLQGCSPTQIQSWADFFLKLGALQHLSVTKETVTLTRQKLSNSSWANYADILPVASEYHITDYVCHEFSGVVSLAKSQPESSRSQEQMANLFKLVERSWDTYYYKFMTCQVCDDAGHVLKEIPTSFSTDVRSGEWVPAAGSKVVETSTSRSARLEGVVGLYCGKHVHVDRPAIRELMDRYANYLRFSPSPESNFAKFLGIKFDVKAEEVQGLLLGISSKTSCESKVSFMKLDHIQAMYKFLQDQLPPKALQDMLTDNPVIFHTDNERYPDALVSGSFLSKNKVRWTDPLELFAKYKDSFGQLIPDVFKESIQHIYPDMHYFFVRCGMIQEVPTEEEFMRLLVEIAATTPVAQARIDFLKIFTYCSQQFDDTDDPAQHQVQNVKLEGIKKIIREKEVIPVTGMWVKIEDRPMISDDKTYEKMFMDKEGVYYVDLGKKTGMRADKQLSKQDLRAVNHESVVRMLQMCDVTMLSQSVDRRSVTENFQPFPDLQSYVGSVVPYLQLLIQNEDKYDDIYQQHVQRGTAAHLAAMSFASVGKLEMVYSLKKLPDVVVVRSETCQILDDQQFCVHYDYMSKYPDINKELARYFSLGDSQCSREVKNFLNELQPLVENPSEELQAFVDQYDLGSLPDDDTKWEVPEPVYHFVREKISNIPEPNETVSTHEEFNMDVQPSDGVLRAWPPRAATGSKTFASHAPSTEATEKVWPPPQPPEHMDRTSLPTNLRPSRYDNEGQSKPEIHVNQECGDAIKHRQAADSESTLGPGGDSHSRPRRSTDGENMPPQETHEKRPMEGLDSEQGNPSSKKHVTEEMHSSCHASEETATVNENASHTSEAVQGEHVTPSDPATSDEPLVIEFHESSFTARHPHKGLKRQRLDSNGRSSYTALTDIKRPFLLHGPPVWLEGIADEEVYQAVGDGSALHLPDSCNIDETSGQKEVGRWGEILVKNHLERILMDSKHGITRVKWVNESKESELPYDIVVQKVDPENPDNCIDVFIEVKSTKSDQKAFFEISSAQIKFALEKAEHFHIYRVFNVGRPIHVRLSKLENLAMKMHTQQVRLAMVV